MYSWLVEVLYFILYYRQEAKKRFTVLPEDILEEFMVNRDLKGPPGS